MKNKLSTHEQEIHEALACSSSSAKRLYLFMLLLTYGLFALSTLVLSPLLISLDSDILTSSTVFPSLLSALMHLIHLSLIPAAAWTVIGFAYFRREDSSLVRRVVAMYFGSLFFCRFCDMAAALMINKALYLEDDIIVPAWYLALDLIYNVCLFLLLRGFVMRHRRREINGIKARIAASPKQSVPILSEPLYPFGSLYQKKHPILTLTLRLGLVFVAVAAIQEIVYTFAIFYDSTKPLSTEEIFVMIGRYVDALWIGACFYLLSLLLYRILFRKAEADSEEADA